MSRGLAWVNEQRFRYTFFGEWERNFSPFSRQSVRKLAFTRIKLRLLSSHNVTRTKASHMRRGTYNNVTPLFNWTHKGYIVFFQTDERVWLAKSPEQLSRLLYPKTENMSSFQLTNNAWVLPAHEASHVTLLVAMHNNPIVAFVQSDRLITNSGATYIVLFQPKGSFKQLRVDNSSSVEVLRKEMTFLMIQTTIKTVNIYRLTIHGLKKSIWVWFGFNFWAESKLCYGSRGRLNAERSSVTFKNSKCRLRDCDYSLGSYL